MSDVIYLTDDYSWDAVIKPGPDEHELTEEQAVEALRREGVEVEFPLIRQAFLEGDASRSEYDRVFYRVPDDGQYPSAFIGWVIEA